MNFMTRSAGAVVLLAVIFGLSSASAQEKSNRVQHGLIVLYDFAENGGQTIHDRSGVGAPLDLTIGESRGIRWSDGTLSIESSTSIMSPQPARKVIDAVKQTNAISVEVWQTPANATQSGPARIVSLSANPNQRNFTLGQDKDRYDVRLRSTDRDNNGLPATNSPKKAVPRRLTHIIFTRDATGAATIYIDGKSVSTKQVDGNFGNWDTRHRLALANEATGDRPWLGSLSLVAIYSRALSTEEVRANFTAGVRLHPVELSREEIAAANFRKQIAPLFAQHCLECHDAAIRKGGLDLSRKSAAFADSDSGPVIIPGKADKSLLWERVASNEMPLDRAALSTDEKAALRKWLEDDAIWSLDMIDPADYEHEGHAGDVWVQRLTVPEYIATVRSTLGVDIAKEARELLPPDMRADGFSNTAYNLSVDLKHVEAYGRLAEIIVERLDVPTFARRFSKSRKFNDDKMRDFIADMGKWLLRGPLNESEVNQYRGIASTVAGAGGDYDQAVAYIIETMLQSPRFIYRIENQWGDGTARVVTTYELASRLSYVLWGTSPDEELMRAVDRGELASRAQVESQVRRMVKDPRTIERSMQFISEWLNLGRLANLRPNAQKFPDWNAELATDMRQETLDFFREVVWKQDRPLVNLLNTQATFATPRLAKHYGLKPLSDDTERYDLSENSSRGGLLTHGSVLTIGGDDASMVSRGLFVLHDLLRGTVNAPPPCVNTTPPPTKAGLTQRNIAEIRIADESCGVCHARFEPLAFGLERFDGVGAYHDRDEHGNKLREDGEILVPGDAKPVKYKSSAELMDLLASSPRVQQSLSWKVTQFALGRPLVAADAPVVTAIHAAAQRDGGTYSSLITAIALSDLVQKTRTERDK